MARKNHLLIIHSANPAVVLLLDIVAVKAELKDIKQRETGDAVGGTVTRTLYLYATVILRNGSSITVFVNQVSEKFVKSRDNAFDLSKLEEMDAQLVRKAQDLFFAEVVAPWQTYIKATYGDE